MCQLDSNKLSRENISIMLKNKTNMTKIKTMLVSNLKYRRFKRALFSVKPALDSLLTEISQSNAGLFDLNRQTEIQYENLCKSIQNSQLIKSVANLLQLYYDYVGKNDDNVQNLTSRKMLFMWVIVGFPQYTIGKTHKQLLEEAKNIYPNEIYNVTINFMSSLYDLSSNKNLSKDNAEILRKFNKYIIRYSDAISYFLERDKAEEISKLVKEYYEINKTLMEILASTKYNDELKQQNTELLNKTKEKVLTQINKFDKSIKKEELESYANMELLQKLKIEETQFQIMLNDIKTKKMFYFKRSLVWILHSLCSIKAKKVVSGYNIKDIIDPDFIIQKIVVSGSYTNNDTIAYGNYIMKIINDLQSPDTVDESNNLWENVKTECFDKQMHVFLTNMIFFVMKEINKIFDQIQLISSLYELDINPII